MIYADVLGAPLAMPGVRSPTSTSTEVRSPTSTRTEVRSPTNTSTDAYTQGNFTSTVTGGAGAGATNVTIYSTPLPAPQGQIGAPMYQATMHRLSFNFDRTRNALVFQGQLESGHTFEVAFPIGHVALTFDNQASELGYCGAPIMGAVDTVDAFLGAVEVMHEREIGRNSTLEGPFDRYKSAVADLQAKIKSGKYTKAQLQAEANNMKNKVFTGGGFFSTVTKPLASVAKGVASVASNAYNATIKKVGQQAVKYARKGVEAVGKAGVAIARSKLVGQALAGVAVVFPAVGAPALAAWGAANRAVAIADSARAGVRSAQNALKTVQRNAVALTHSGTPNARMALAGLKAVAA